VVKVFLAYPSVKIGSIPVFSLSAVILEDLDGKCFVANHHLRFVKSVFNFETWILLSFSSISSCFVL
jgi:hypothetical protein